MHKVTVNHSFNYLNDVVQPGEYIMDDINAGEMLMKRLPVKVDSYSIAPHSLKQNDVLFVRPGGYGDLLFLTPAFKQIKKDTQCASIDVACRAWYRDVLLGNPNVRNFLDYPIRREILESYKIVVWLEGYIENSEDAHHKHVVDLLGDIIRSPIQDKTMDYFIATGEVEEILARFPVKEGWDRVAIQVQASTPVRTYPSKLMDQVITLLLKSNQKLEIFLLGTPNSIEAPTTSRVINATKLDKPLTFRQSCALLKTCGAVLAPDSSLCHVAGAMNIPTVALYGPFPWKLRTAYAPSITAISGVAECAPCFYHSTAYGSFPRDKPCSKERKCVAMDSIDPEKVFSAVKKKLNNR